MSGMVPRAPEASSFLQRPPHPIQNPSVQSKTSAVSLSPSNEADDERSASPFSVMGSYHEPEHAEEDRRPTSQKELAGFYAYGFAAEVSNARNKLNFKSIMLILKFSGICGLRYRY